MNAKFEAEHFKDTFKNISANNLPSQGFVVVQPRIKTRIFAPVGKIPENCAPCYVLDHTLARALSPQPTTLWSDNPAYSKLSAARPPAAAWSPAFRTDPTTLVL